MQFLVFKAANEEEENYLQWLKTSQDEPWSDIQEYWAKTSGIRNKKLVDGNLSISEYMATYPVIRQQLGFSLVWFSSFLFNLILEYQFNIT